MREDLADLHLIGQGFVQRAAGTFTIRSGSSTPLDSTSVPAPHSRCSGPRRSAMV
jgi:hypothetical protein